jgi:hypothetical protein
MNCNAKKELSQHISASRTLYVKEPHVAREPRFGHPCSISRLLEIELLPIRLISSFNVSKINFSSNIIVMFYNKAFAIDTSAHHWCMQINRSIQTGID